MNEINKQFEIKCSSIKKSVSEDSTLILEGIATTSSMDLVGDYVTQDCIESMKTQIQNLNVHYNHAEDLNGIIGSVIKVLDTDENSLKILFNVLPSYKDKILELLENGVNLGLSIRGKAVEKERTRTGWQVNKILLLEVSLTTLPANWNTFGSVKISDEKIISKCLNGACKTILKNLKDTNNIMVKEDTNNKTTEENKNSEVKTDENPITEKQVMDYINEALNNFKQEFKEEFKKEIVEEYKLDELKNNNASPEPKDENNDDEGSVEKKLNLEEEVTKRLDAFKDEFFKGLNENRNPQSTDFKKMIDETKVNNNSNNVLSSDKIAERLLTL